MLLQQIILPSILILAVTAQHGTSEAASSAATTLTLFTSATLIPKSGQVPLFGFEEEQCSQALLDQLRPAQRRLFTFDETKATDDAPPKDGVSCGSYDDRNQTRCKRYPGDAAWPKLGGWKQLNNTLGGSLIKGLPAASVCHINGTSQHDEATCIKSAANWTNS